MTNNLKRMYTKKHTAKHMKCMLENMLQVFKLPCALHMLDTIYYILNQILLNTTNAILVILIPM